MRDWEPYQKNTSQGEDPWDFRQEDRASSRRRLQRHSPAAGHVIGSCEDGNPPPRQPSAPPPPQPPRPRRKQRTLFIVLFTILLICALAYALSTVIQRTAFRELLPSGGSSQQSEPVPSGDDDFAVDVAPEEEPGEEPLPPVDSVDESVVPSDIERYEGGAEFTLTLGSAEGLTPLSYQEIYAKVLPSVVTITVYNETGGAYATGIVLSEDGYILTNQHVVGGESYAQVTTEDNVSYEALLVGEDPNSDLAVLKVDAEGLIPAEFGSSEELTVGDECFAIGNPLGVTYRGTFTNGIISALNRSVNMNEYTMTLIQTTAALNSGNSGGPLINIYGQVIGVNNMKIMSSATTVEGLGFAIPSATARSVANALISTGTVEHPVIGITCFGVTDTGPERFGATGVLVVTVNENSDAYRQGMQVNDIITAVNGQSVASVADITECMGGLGVGDSLTVTVYREGEGELDITFELMEQNELK